MKLRLRLPKVSGPPKELDLDGETPWLQLLQIIEQESGIPHMRIKLLGGFPPRPIQPAEGDDFAMISTLFKDGELLNVQEGAAVVRQGSTDGKYVPPSADKQVFVRRRMPGDNSCLFHAVSYLVNNKSREGGPKLRQECADAVLANPDTFTTALLGQSPQSYAAWVRQPTSWGGAIELMILSFLYQTEIIALDLQGGTVQRFGETKNYSVRGFVVYTGDHYDAIGVVNATNGGQLGGGRESDDQVLFNPRDEKVLQRAIQFVAEERQKK